MNRILTLTLCAAVLSGVPASAQQVRFDDVVRNLRNPDPKIRINAVRLLKESGYLEAVGPIAPLVNDPVDEIQLEAIGAELAFYLVEPVPAKKRVALFVEVRSQGRAASAFDMGRLASWPRPVPTELASALLTAVDDENAKVRLEAIYTLGVIARPPLADEHAQRLIKALDHYDPVIRAAAAKVVGRLTVTSAGDALIRAVNDSSPQVRYAAMRALGEIKHEPAIQALNEQLSFYGKGEGAWSALHALSRIAHASSIPVFKARMTDRDPLLRRAAIEGLANARDTSEISALEIAAGNDSSEPVRAAAAYTLQTLGRNYIPRLVESLDSDKMAPQIAGYLVDLGEPIVGPLAVHLVDQDPVIRANVVQILGVIGGDAALKAIGPMLQDRDKSVVEAATRAIERIKMNGR